MQGVAGKVLRGKVGNADCHTQRDTNLSDRQCRVSLQNAHNPTVFGHCSHNSVFVVVNSNELSS